jgi:hypothetical protein
VTQFLGYDLTQLSLNPGFHTMSDSSAPQSFSNSSPFTKKSKKKDPKGNAIMAVGVIGIIACVAAIALTLIMRSS